MKKKGSIEGFTLLEVLVSITLMALLIVVLSLALRSGINAYTRIKAGNENFFPEAAIEGLLYRQLENIIEKTGSSLSGFSYFFGDSDMISFTTTYSPSGLSQGGVIQVIYAYDDENKGIIYAQKILTKPFDLKQKISKDFLGQHPQKLLDEGWIIDEIKGIEELEFAFRPPLLDENVDVSDWPKEHPGFGPIPSEIAIKIKFKDQKFEQNWHVIPVGIL